MNRFYILAVLFLSVTLSGSLSQEKRHDENCPTKCERCRTAVKKALDFLASNQTKAGRIQIDEKVSKHKYFKNASSVICQ